LAECSFNKGKEITTMGTVPGQFPPGYMEIGEIRVGNLLNADPGGFSIIEFFKSAATGWYAVGGGCHLTAPGSGASVKFIIVPPHADAMAAEANPGRLIDGTSPMSPCFIADGEIVRGTTQVDVPDSEYDCWVFVQRLS
jgi:hypothetical protein